MQANGPIYEVALGRRDGRVSNASHADNMPHVGDSIQQLKLKFFDKGLSEKDLILIKGTRYNYKLLQKYLLFLMRIIAWKSYCSLEV